MGTECTSSLSTACTAITLSWLARSHVAALKNMEEKEKESQTQVKHVNLPTQTHPIPRVVIQRGCRAEQRVLGRRARARAGGGRCVEARGVQAQAVRQARRVGALDRRAQPRHNRVHLRKPQGFGQSVLRLSRASRQLRAA